MCTKNWSSILLTLCVAAIANAQSRYLENPLPQTWQLGEDSLFVQQTLPIDDQWWKVFDDSKLDSLIAVAIKQNYSVLTAIDRIEASRANLRIARSNLFPSIEMGAGWTRQQTSGHTSQLPQEWSSAYSATLSGSWELDLFGSIRQRVKAQRENFYASKEEYTSTMISLCAEVASAYINLRETQQELEVVNHNCITQEAVLRLTEARYQSGLVSKLDVSQARSVYYSTRASIPQLEVEINQYINTLAVLLGVYPQDIRPTLIGVGNLPDYIEAVATGIPADLLMRRPDIRAAERQVNAQAAQLGASRADWLPQFFLKGSWGYASHDLKDLVRSSSMTFEIAPSISWNIFSGGKLINATKLARTQLDEAIYQFNSTVLSAIQETDNAMTSYQSSIKQIVLMKEVCLQGEETLKLSIDLYKQGLAPFQNVLDALRSLLTYENQLTQAKGYSLKQLISLYKALGGGW